MPDQKTKPLMGKANELAADIEPSASREPLANGESLANEEPSANKEPSAYRKPSADREPLANNEPSAKKEPSAHKEQSRVLLPILALIWLYQKMISPLLGPRCRFYPSCSHYAKESLIRHGLLKGGYLTARRCLKCHPFHPGGIDPVPESRDQKSKPVLNPNKLGETS